ncbi:hypothetical protein K431DRAFT_252492 [Polychaeton citri CBS 116435]|uniref:Actin cortical patch SUR7/pH-response regulator PalI n=1 Tax=Polychaeton citri CBS 116435 TaxID=1314669 RepID=A0A9P4Q631_9PEZI|nr:hypothetical protein K431DRAFT_252492 [Polychaeton citri CBS 116435]
MYFTPVGAVILTGISLILTFLTLFAGSSPGFLEDYALVTLNTSQIGSNIFNTSEGGSSSDNAITGFLHNVTDSIQSEIEDTLNSFAKDLGVHDFYSAHILTSCEGYYTPASVPNATLERTSIRENVTNCSSIRAFSAFDPQETLQRELNRSGHGNVSLSDLHWPEDISRGIGALKVAQRATFFLYCMALCSIFLAFCLAGLSSFLLSSRVVKVVVYADIAANALAFLSLGIASAIATTVAVQAAKLVNRHGNGVGISASEGRKFIALTWTATGLVLVVCLIWTWEWVFGIRKRTGGGGNWAKFG